VASVKRIIEYVLRFHAVIDSGISNNLLVIGPNQSSSWDVEQEVYLLRMSKMPRGLGWEGSE
jgi:hypothetical protein